MMISMITRTMIIITMTITRTMIIIIITITMTRRVGGGTRNSQSLEELLQWIRWRLLDRQRRWHLDHQILWKWSSPSRNDHHHLEMMIIIWKWSSTLWCHFLSEGFLLSPMKMIMMNNDDDHWSSSFIWNHPLIEGCCLPPARTGSSRDSRPRGVWMSSRLKGSI